MNLQQGLVQVYTGDGDEKSAAALGQAMRAAGHGLTVYIARFRKSWILDGELRTAAEHPYVTLRQFGRHSFVEQNDPDAVDLHVAQEALEQATGAVTSGRYDLVILDEVNVALEWRLIRLGDLLSLLDRKPEEVEIVLTCRHAHPILVARADLVTEMSAMKHPYDGAVNSHRAIG